MATSRYVIIAGAVAVLAGGAAPSAVGGQSAAAPATTTPAVKVAPVLETEPVGHSGDAADDPAFWLHPSDASRSMIIGADKRGALETYDLRGRRLQRIGGVKPNNVDVRGNLVVAADDESRSGVLRVYGVSPTTRQLSWLATIPTEVTAHGLCLYQSPRTRKLYAFPNSLSGRVEQLELAVRGRQVTARSVRIIDVGGPVEGCVADDATTAFYIGEEKKGIWRYGAEPNYGSRRVLVDQVRPRGTTQGRGNLISEVEGLAIAGDRLYASSQGSNDFTVYHRITNAYLGRFQVGSGAGADGCQDTDGIDVVSRPLGSAFPNGLFVCQDGWNSGNAANPKYGAPAQPAGAANQNFKFVPLERIVRSIPGAR